MLLSRRSSILVLLGGVLALLVVSSRFWGERTTLTVAALCALASAFTAEAFSGRGATSWAATAARLWKHQAKPGQPSEQSVDASVEAANGIRTARVVHDSDPAAVNQSDDINVKLHKIENRSEHSPPPEGDGRDELMEVRMTADRKRCFVIMPFGDYGTKGKAHYDEVYEHVIRRTLESAGIECVRADKMSYSGEITTQVLQELHDADLVLADLSDSNPNVFYELGFRHALGRPSIIIRDDIAEVPFNVSTHGMIFYSLTAPQLDHARDEIRHRAERELEKVRRDRAPDSAEMLREPDVSERLRVLEDTVENGLESLYRLMNRSMPVHQAMERNAEEQREILRDIVRRVDSVPHAADELVRASSVLQKSNELGLVNIYPSRLDAIEDEFFAIMQREEEGIDLVGSTVFGARGHHRVTGKMVLDLLAEKLRRPGFILRMLLTHPDYISHRQDQERATKNYDRIVISGELKNAVDSLIHAGLTDHVRFYRGAPTCFMVICRSEKMLLANPYPYQLEAYKSWTAIFRETAKSSVYDQFGEHHFEQPWSREDLAIPFSDDIVDAVERKLQEDIARVHREMADTLGRPEDRSA